MPENDESTIDCPLCGQPFEPAAGALQQCSHCGGQFFVESEEPESDEDREAREALERRAVEQKERLDDRHIRVVQLEKRSIYRARTWMLVLGFACVGIAGQLVWLGVNWFRDIPANAGPPAVEARQAQPSRGVAYFVIAAGMGMVSMRFFHRARRYTREADAMTLPEPTAAPDFSTLNDGSQIVEELKRMTDEPKHQG